MHKRYLLPIFLLALGILIGLFFANFEIKQLESFADKWGSLVLSATLVFVTIYYAWQTRQSVKIMEESALPYVSVHLHNDPSHITDIYLVIRNDGNQSAFDVKLNVLAGDIQVTESPSRSGKLSDMLFIKSKLAVLSPKSERKHLILMTTPSTWKTVESVRTSLSVTYRDKNNKEYTHNYDLDYASLPFSGEPKDSTYQKPEKSLQEMAKTLSEIAQK